MPVHVQLKENCTLFRFRAKKKELSISDRLVLIVNVVSCLSFSLALSLKSGGAAVQFRGADTRPPAAKETG